MQRTIILLSRHARRMRLDAGTLGLWADDATITGRYLPKLLRGILSNQPFPSLEPEQAREIIVYSPLPFLDVAIDGELTHLVPPLVHRIVPRALRVIGRNLDR